MEEYLDVSFGASELRKIQPEFGQCGFLSLLVHMCEAERPRNGGQGGAGYNVTLPEE